MWPGFNLQLPTLTTNIWGSQFDLETPTDSVWRMPPSTNSWPVTASTTAEPPSPVSITESVRSFRLNPDAQPFTLSTTQRPAEERNDFQDDFYFVTYLSGFIVIIFTVCVCLKNTSVFSLHLQTYMIIHVSHFIVKTRILSSHLLCQVFEILLT